MFTKISAFLQWIGRHFLGMIFLLIVVVVFTPSSSTELNPPNLQEIELTGAIMNSDKIIKEIEEAYKNENIKGVLLTINSPGGAVAPSIEISYAIRELNKKKPVIAYGGGVLASGSYYSAIYASKIIANPGAIVGSIGVIMESANIEEFMNTIGIKTQIVKQGRYKEAGTPTRKWTKEEREELERLTKDTYDLFVKDVSNARKLDINNSKEYADAHIFSAFRAKSVGLVDIIGTKRVAKKELMKLTKVKKPVWNEKNKIDTFIEDFGAKTIQKIENSFFGLKATI